MGPDLIDSARGKVYDVGPLGPGAGARAGCTSRGRLNGINTPTLHGLWNTPPYFHDGSAADLLEVIERSGPEHGDLRALATDERAQLVAYLLQLAGPDH